MKACSIATCLTVLIAFPATGQQAPVGDEHSAHHPQTAQAQPDVPGQVPSQGPGRMKGMMGSTGQEGRGGMMAGMMGAGMMQPSMAGTIPMMKIMFAVADANGDGGLSFEEVMAMHKRVFDAADSNKDGKVTQVEMQAFFEK